MLDFLKRFGLGILYVLISPFVITFLLLWAIFDLGLFFVGLMKGFVSFFKGHSFFPEFQEDVEAKRILSLEPYVENQNIDTTQQAQTPPANNDGGGQSL